MAKKVENHDFRGRGASKANKERFPKEWFDGEPWEAEQGEDFNMGPTSFRSVIGEQAKVYGMKIRANVYPDEGKVIFQAYTPEEDRALDPTEEV
jgi:hypothetical protein